MCARGILSYRIVQLNCDVEVLSQRLHYSVEGNASDQVGVVIIISIANAIGRLVTGLLSDQLYVREREKAKDSRSLPNRQTKVPRIVFLLGCLFIIGSSNLLLSFAADRWVVYSGAPGVAFAYGG